MNSNQHNVIADIRNKYGILKDGTQLKKFDFMSRGYSAAIEQLSTGLYEKEVHFILELIQNAEDNEYKKETPNLRFVILDEDPTNTPDSDGCLCIFNNEVGFKKQHVESICQIGQSTKEKIQGYVGEKGIGFKAVFLVSSAPHIYSNGYRFKFKEKDPDIRLSYIVPYWLDNIPAIVKKDEFNTAILLPLKPDKKNHIVAELKRIRPETVLFLSKLDGLSVHIRSESMEINLVRDKTHAPIIDLLIKHKNKKTVENRYWMYASAVTVPNDIKEEKRAGITDREIAIAFPLKNNGHAGTIYAFLPTEQDSGLPFLINADFILTANRGSIQTDKEWNIWLRNELANLVVQGLEALSKSQEHRKSLCGFIPLTDEIKDLKDYFEPLCEAVYPRLSCMKIVLSDEDVLIEPVDARLASNKIREIFDGDSRPAAFNNFKLVNVELQKHEKRLKAIGVKRFSNDDIKSCLSDRQWLSSKTSDWFFMLYDFLRDSNNDLKSDLGELPVIPTHDDRLVSREQEQVYFSADYDLANKLDERLSTVGKKPTFIKKELFSILSKKPELLAWVKENLAVTDFSFSTYVVNTLVPWLYEYAHQIKEKNFLDVVRLILEYWHEITEEHRIMIGEKMPLLLDNGVVTRPDELKEGAELLTPRALDKDKGWQLILKTEADYGHAHVLSNKYLNLNEGNGEQFDEFLTAIKAQRYPKLREDHIIEYNRDERYKPYNEYISATFAGFNEEWSSAPTIKTWLTPSFFHNPTQRNNKKNRVAFLYWLEKMLENRPDSLRYGKIDWYYYKDKSRQIESGVIFYLKKTLWINTSKGFKNPGLIFKKTNQIYEMFGNKLAYLKDEISLELCGFLGVKTEVTTPTILEYLRERSGQQEVDIKLITKLYKYLDEHGHEYAESFHEDALIYIPKSGKHWYKSSEVIWNDASQTLGDLYGWVSPIYTSHLKQFFLGELEISEYAQNKDLQNAWLRLPERKDLTPEDIAASLSEIYPRLLVKAKSSNPDWCEGFVDGVMLWTQNDEFQKKNDVYVPDDFYLRKLFRGNLSFIWKPENLTHRDLDALYTVLGVTRLSENIEVSLENSGAAIKTESPVFLTNDSKQLLCYMIYNDSLEKYEELRKSGVLDQLLQSVEVTTNSLTIRYDVCGVAKTVKDYNAFWEPYSCRIYLRSGIGKEDLLDDVVEVIARALWGKAYKKYEDHVRTTLGITNIDRFKKIKDKKGWRLPRKIREEIRQLINQSSYQQLDNQNEYSIEKDDVNSSSSVSTTTQSDQANPKSNEKTNSRPKQPRDQIGSGVPTDDTYKKEPNITSNNIQEHKSGSQYQGEKSSTNHRRNQMISHVASESSAEPNESDREANRQAQERRKELGEQGEIEVLKDLQAKGYTVKRMPPNNKGYDLEAVNPKTSETLYIEVKGDSYDWTTKGVGLTPSQYRFGLEKNHSFYLAVVENLKSSPRNIYYIQNPVNEITQYRFDEGWKNMSIQIGSVDSS